MTDVEVLLKMKDILERMFTDEYESHHISIKLAHTLVLGELSKAEPKIFESDVGRLIAILLEEIFIERGLPPFKFS